MAAFLFAMNANWSYFIEEHERLHLWQAVLIWTGDVVSLLWFIQFFVAHAILELPFQSESAVATGRRLWSAALVTILCSLAVDFAVTSLCIFDEWQGYKRSVPATARVTHIEKSGWFLRGEEVATWITRYQFTDSHGVTFHGTFRMRKGYHIQVDPPLPADVVSEVQAALTPFELPIRYDPKWPSRSWPIGVDWHGDGDDLQGISLAILCWQAFISIVFVLILWAAQREGRNLWWSETYKVVPFAVEVVMWTWIALMEAAFPRFLK